MKSTNSRLLSIAAAAALSISLAGLGGCATVAKDIDNNKAGIAGAVVTGAAAHALTGGASTAWRAVTTGAGIVGGWILGKKLADEK